MKEPTRPIPQPTVDRDGSLVAHTVATPTAFKVRARVTIGSRKVIPVIFVPGVMGSNLRARRDLKARQDDMLAPGEAAWRPPNGLIDGFWEARKWAERSPSERQRILDASMLEVDPNGQLDFVPATFDAAQLRARGWGEVHAGSYGTLLIDLQRHLDKTFQVSPQGSREIRHFWLRVMQSQPESWGVRQVEKITEAELEKYAAYQYPVYAVGYNWLESCEKSARRLRERIDQIKRFWTERKHQCTRVILITHSMGGLVARACARMSAPGDGSAPDIAGIIHAAMPALGAPVTYRRIACGTEGGRYTNGFMDNLKAGAVMDMVGESAADTTPVMAVSPGVLQLLPNHLYPKPWLVIKTIRSVNRRDEVRDLLSLPDGNPYDFYRDMKSWYRMIDPDLADPAKRFNDADRSVREVISDAINDAEQFHTSLLTLDDGKKGQTPYYHPNTYAFHGADKSLKAYGQIRWVARETSVSSAALTPSDIRNGNLASVSENGARDVRIGQGLQLRFSLWPEDAHGDETVPVQSGAGPTAHIRQMFAPTGVRHQDSVQPEAMRLLIRHLIVKIVQEVR